MKLSALWRRENSRYFVLAILPFVAVALAIVLDDVSFGQQFDKYAYDFLFRLEQPDTWQPSSIVLAIDDRTLLDYGGQTGIRDALADGLERIAPAKPAAVAVDVILADPGSPKSDRNLELAFSKTHNLILASYVLRDNRWNEPIERFRRYAVYVGQVHAEVDRYDAVSRDLPLAKVAGIDRRWALAFDTFLAAKGLHVDEESPEDIVAGPVRIPTMDGEEHTIRIRYPPFLETSGFPQVSIAELDRDPSLAQRFAGKAVFVGETVQAFDPWMTPYSNSKPTPGIEINASLYETLARQSFLVDAPVLAVLGVCFALSLGASLIYAFGSGWISNLLAAAVVGISQAIPALAFAHSVVWPWLPGAVAAVFSVAIASTSRHLTVRRDLAKAERQRPLPAGHAVRHA